MAFKAAEATSRALYEHGPAILRYPHVYGYDAEKKKKKTEDRLQLAPDDRHQADKDPHKNGRALDIVLVSTSPSERAEADKLVEIFLELRETMQWETVIYNRSEWNVAGSKSARLSSDPDPYEKASFEHITHIHIQWSDNKKDLDTFYEPLVKRLRGAAADFEGVGSLDSVLPGRWDFWIGDPGSGWHGWLEFTATGAVSWAPFDKPAQKHPGTWRVEDSKLKFSFSTPGDMRTFVCDLPLTGVDAPGTILPPGQGWFSMTRM
jgi:hypothetical protein